MNTNFENVDAYIASFPKEIQEILTQIRKIILQTTPQAVESISYGMPAYKLNKKPLVYFAAFKHHIGFYATPNGNEAFHKELAQYKQGKGSVQFPFENVPYDLIQRMVRYRVETIK